MPRAEDVRSRGETNHLRARRRRNAAQTRLIAQKLQKL
jgi:hypothetical protein